MLLWVSFVRASEEGGQLTRGKGRVEDVNVHTNVDVGISDAVFDLGYYALRADSVDVASCYYAEAAASVIVEVSSKTTDWCADSSMDRRVQDQMLHVISPNIFTEACWS